MRKVLSWEVCQGGKMDAQGAELGGLPRWQDGCLACRNEGGFTP